MYTLIGMKLVTKADLETVYTLDEALKLYSLWRMEQDIKTAKARELKDKVSNKARRRR